MVTLFSLQRHFAVFAISFPGLDALKTIYLSILNGHINALGLPQAVQKNAEKLVDAALAMNQKVCFFFLNFSTRGTDSPQVTLKNYLSHLSSMRHLSPTSVTLMFK